jgi:hypothetical protein
MSEFPKGRPDRPTIIATAALMVAIAALIAAVGGIAGAAPGKTVVRKVVVRKGMVHKGEIAPGAVTAKAIAHGAISANKIRKEAITAQKLAKASVSKEALAAGAVTPEAIAADAVTAGAIAPGSVYGGALGTETVVTKPISDLDTLVDKTWTASNIETALCGVGEVLLGGGIGFTNPGDGEVAVLQMTPYLNGPSKGFMGRITSNAAGATAQVSAICLK